MTEQGTNHRLRFDATITLGTVIHVVAMAIIFVVAWVHVTDRLQVLEDSKQKQEVLFERQSELLQTMQLNQAQQTVIIQNLERRLGIVEDVNGFGAKKR